MKQLGNIASILTSEFTEEHLPTGVLPATNKVQLCAEIDLNYPVLESLSYSSKLVDTGSVALILSLKGRPSSFQTGEGWSGYDIFNVLVEGEIYQCFRSSLEIITR